MRSPVQPSRTKNSSPAVPQLQQSGRLPWRLANVQVHHLVNAVVRVTQPDSIYWCNGSKFELDHLLADAWHERAVSTADERRDSRVIFTDLPCDIVEVSAGTFDCCAKAADCRPGHHWMNPVAGRLAVQRLFDGAMRGRRLYVVPSANPSEAAGPSIEILLTDDLDRVIHRCNRPVAGDAALQLLGDRLNFSGHVHAAGLCHPDHGFICHFLDDNRVWSLGV